jgi:hypothetical protein
MKLLLLFILSLSTSAQTLFSEDMLWSTIHESYSDDYFRTSYYTKIDSDTVISEKQYSMVLNSDDSLMVKWSLAGFVREEGQKVFYRNTEDDGECLLYDFGCTVGDTLNLNCWCPESETYFKVDSIKSVPVLGSSRKHIYMSYLNNSSTLIWIEGIGSMNGFLNSGGPGNCMTGFHEELLCCFNNNIKTYQNPDYNACYVNTTAVTSLEDQVKLIEVFPSDIGTLTIRTSNNKQGKFMLFDLEGRHIVKQDINNIETQLCLQQSGVFIYRFTSTEGEIQTGKVRVK